jgi:hypothetical protein
LVGLVWFVCLCSRTCNFFYFHAVPLLIFGMLVSTC